jgi:hypothetical protein
MKTFTIKIKKLKKRKPFAPVTKTEKDKKKYSRKDNKRHEGE